MRAKFRFAMYGQPRNRFSVDERIIFERLWRGALCGALDANKSAMRAPPRRQCCCHCHCFGTDGLSVDAVAHNGRRNAMRSVVRFVLR